MKSVTDGVRVVVAQGRHEAPVPPYRVEDIGEVEDGDGDGHGLQQHRRQQQDPEMRNGAAARARHPPDDRQGTARTGQAPCATGLLGTSDTSPLSVTSSSSSTGWEAVKPVIPAAVPSSPPVSSSSLRLPTEPEPRAKGMMDKHPGTVQVQELGSVW